MKKVYCHLCQWLTNLGIGGYRCDAPENQIEKSSGGTWLYPPGENFSISDKPPYELNIKNECPYFKAGKPHH